MSCIKHMGGAYLGFSLAMFGNIPFTTWQFWGIAVPTIFLFMLEKKYEIKNLNK
jgi:hypothetical protein